MRKAKPTNIKRTRIIQVVRFSLLPADFARSPMHLPAAQLLMERLPRLVLLRVALSPPALILQHLLLSSGRLKTFSFVGGYSLTSSRISVTQKNVKLGAFLAFIQVPVAHLGMLIESGQRLGRPAFKTRLFHPLKRHFDFVATLLAVHFTFRRSRLAFCPFPTVDDLLFQPVGQ